MTNTASTTNHNVPSKTSPGICQPSVDSMRARVLSCFSHVRLFVILWTADFQASLSMGFSRQEHWNGMPFPPPRDPTQGSNLQLLHLLYQQAGSLPLKPPGKPSVDSRVLKYWIPQETPNGSAMSTLSGVAPPSPFSLTLFSCCC